MLASSWVIFLLFQSCSLGLCQNFYDQDPNIIELTPKNFDKVIHRTNYTTVVEFYAPWCGYCQQLKSKMKKVGKSLEGIVQVASVNCDVASNKQLCAQQKIKGYPTIMVYRPPKIDISKPELQQIVSRQHASEVYNGERKLMPIVEFALSRMKNYVKRLGGLAKIHSLLLGSKRKKLVLFSRGENVSPIYKSVALDWLGEFECYAIHNGKLNHLSGDSVMASSFPNTYEFLQSLVTSQKDSSKSLLTVLDPVTDKVFVYDGDSFTKLEISKFLSETFDVQPREGPLSKREDFLNQLRKNKKKWYKKAAHNEL